LGTPFLRRQIGQEISGGIREIKSHNAGQKNLHTHTLKDPTPLQVIGVILKLSQAGFAGFMGVSVRMIQD
jgi:DNA-binding transcriptional regulator YiaG